jgi:beta-phosphoglucomutase-like phosphatase (HAD superfamily)
MIDLIIFDLDGVLIDTEHTHYSALCNSINYVTGLSHADIRKIIKTDGSTTKSKLKILQSEYGFADYICAEINRIKQETVLKEFVHIIPNYEQMQMLSVLSQKYKLAIGSNSRKTSVDIIVDSLDIRKFFTHVISIDDVKIEKPDPAIFNYLMNILDITKEHTLIIEDSERGIDAVRRSGAHLLETTFKKTTLEYIENAIRKIETDHYCSNGRARI